MEKTLLADTGENSQINDDPMQQLNENDLYQVNGGVTFLELAEGNIKKASSVFSGMLGNVFQVLR